MVLWVTPKDGVSICLGCKRVNGAKYRKEHRAQIRINSRVARYGMTLEDFRTLWDSQHGQCAICGLGLDKAKYRIDHDHKTGKVRGILCASCNTALGLFKDSPDSLNRAMSYLHANG